MWDFLSLNKVVVLPWDSWAATEVPVSSFTPVQTEQVDRIAALTLAGNEAFAEIRALDEENPDYHFILS